MPMKQRLRPTILPHSFAPLQRCSQHSSLTSHRDQHRRSQEIVYTPRLVSSLANSLEINISAYPVKQPLEMKIQLVWMVASMIAGVLAPSSRFTPFNPFPIANQEPAPVMVPVALPPSEPFELRKDAEKPVDGFRLFAMFVAHHDQIEESPIDVTKELIENTSKKPIVAITRTDVHAFRLDNLTDRSLTYTVQIARTDKWIWEKVLPPHASHSFSVDTTGFIWILRG
ncbi:hypothetical protein PtA15_5A230 [Puccinia triticina]|uniref:Uncharacterized protein n=1 Tax=Puccinia triticina TaxID=208348 RepID=A0ABY7CPG8_9BASI|nr:uncharacterized protein PtA15_5A230 [Puccinia triticina]WAQ84657.1 hypothetical protein PtA15_5A230 [Puccinia triticina]WAR58003.1 hypothetical protein PtB15_5B233 [Puccinia triticina]